MATANAQFKGHKLLAEARIFAATKAPYLRSALMALVPVERPGLGTCAMDAHGRLYYDADFLTARDIKTRAFIITHELIHWHQRHAQRQIATCRSDAERLAVWRKTVECPTNELVTSIFGGYEPDEATTSAKLGLPHNLTVEEAFALKWQEHVEAKEQEKQRQEEERKRQEEAEKQRQQDQEKSDEDDEEESQDQDGEEGQGQEADAPGDEDAGSPRPDGEDDGSDGQPHGETEGGEQGADEPAPDDADNVSSPSEPTEGDQGPDDLSDGEAEDGGGDDGAHGGEDGRGKGELTNEPQNQGDEAEGQEGSEGQEGQGDQPSGDQNGSGGQDQPGDPQGNGPDCGEPGGDSGVPEDSGQAEGGAGAGEGLSDEELAELAAEIGGSASDGIQRPWEMGEPSDEAPGLSESDQQLIEATVAKEIEAAVARGMLPSSNPLAKQARELLHPKADPFRELAAKVRFHVETTCGFGSWTYNAPSNRQLPGGVILPSCIKPVPRIVVIVDTSGSMQAEDLGKALAAIGDGLRSLPDPRGLRVLCGGTRIESAANIFRKEQIQLVDGGGTALDVIMRQAMEEKPEPKALLVITDGETSWPREEEIKAKVLVALTRKSRWCSPPPKWMDVVALHAENE